MTVGGQAVHGKKLGRLPDQWNAYVQFISTVEELKVKEVTKTYTVEGPEQLILSPSHARYLACSAASYTFQIPTASNHPQLLLQV